MGLGDLEQACFLDMEASQVYVMEYGCEDPQAVILLCGPFPSDRLFSLGEWAKWGRYLARHGITAVRFDYRGFGESTGRFVDMDFTKWLEDICQMSRWSSERFDNCPLVLHGMGMGALLAQKAFATGLGDALLMWSAPAHGLEILRQGLMVRLSMDMLLQPPGQRKTAQQYIAELKEGKTVQVDGYPWSAGLWESGEQLQLDREYSLEREGKQQGRPWYHLALADDMAPLARSSRVLRAMNPRAAIVPETPLNPDFTVFFEQNLSWIRKCAGQAAGRLDHA